jgi:hypothetical protein
LGGDAKQPLPGRSGCGIRVERGLGEYGEDSMTDDELVTALGSALCGDGPYVDRDAPFRQNTDVWYVPGMSPEDVARYVLGFLRELPIDALMEALGMHSEVVSGGMIGMNKVVYISTEEYERD